VPATIAVSRAQPEQGAVRRWQAGHHGRLVMREMPQAVMSPQIEQFSTGSVWQVAQSGPSGVRRLTRRRRPQPRQVCRLAGSVMKQLAQIG